MSDALLLLGASVESFSVEKSLDSTVESAKSSSDSCFQLIYFKVLC